jgi:hypothetical protein
MKPASFGIDQILAKMEQALNIDWQTGRFPHVAQ